MTDKVEQSKSEIRFSEARERLSAALSNLESISKKKILEKEEKIQQLEQKEDPEITNEKTIQALKDEINNLQKTVSEIDLETEFTKEKNKMLLEKISNMRKSGLTLVEEVEKDLTRISKLINE